MPKVFIAKTQPGSVAADYVRLLNSAGWWGLGEESPVILKLNLSWTKFYPACSTPPWQLEGVVRFLLESGLGPEQIVPVENQTVVTDVYRGAANQGWLKTLARYGIKIHFLPDEEYVKYQPKSKMLVLDKVFPQGLYLPKIILGRPIIHLPTMKTHVFTTTTGAIKNYFGVLGVNRHFAHRYIHETLVDLLRIQKEVHPKIFGVMDGTVVGSGPGPRSMEWHEGNYILAGEDLVALDSTAARMMGFNPLGIEYLKSAKERGLGEADPGRIEIVGEEIADVNFHFKAGDTLASKVQKLIYRHSPPWLEKVLLQSPAAPWSYLASRIYFDVFWSNLIGRARVGEFFRSPWGQAFKSYLSS